LYGPGTERCAVQVRRATLDEVQAYCRAHLSLRHYDVREQTVKRAPDRPAWAKEGWVGGRPVSDSIIPGHYSDTCATERRLLAWDGSPPARPKISSWSPFADVGTPRTRDPYTRPKYRGN
jgi:hypothetical protein